MKIVILHQHFNTPVSGGPLRSYYLATALVERGHDVTVITTTQTGKSRQETVEGIDVHYLAIAYSNSFGFFDRTRAFIRYAFAAFRIASAIPKTDLCYAISVPLTVGIPAILLKKFRNLPFIFEVGDLWPDAPIELGFVRNPVLKSFLRWFERTVYHHAKSIVALSDPIRESILAKAPGKLVDVIPNMADTEFLAPSTKTGGYTSSSPFVISYIGAIGFANGLDHLVECARACQKAKLPVRFVICGAGAFAGNLKTVSAKLNIGNLSFVEFQNREGVRALLDRTDAVFVSYRPFPILETGSPNKYFDGLAAGKMIIVNFSGWIRSEVEKMSCGFYVSTQRPHEIVDALTPYLQDSALVISAQTTARSLATTKYSRNVLGKRFADAIDRR